VLRYDNIPIPEVDDTFKFLQCLVFLLFGGLLRSEQFSREDLRANNFDCKNFEKSFTHKQGCTRMDPCTGTTIQLK